MCPVGSDFGDEEGAARRAVERQERSVEGTEGWSSFEKPCEGLGLFYGGCFMGAVGFVRVHTRPSWELAPP